MRVLIDYAHNDLWESLELLFADRLGWDLYRPIGMDWYDEGIWNFERATLGDAVAHQFLDPWPSDVPVDPAFGWGTARPDDMHPGRAHHMVTLEQARSMSWDVVIATLAENEVGLHGFATERGARFGIQIGNQGAANSLGLASFVMSSVTLPGVSLWMPHVFYRQEFSLTDFRYEWPPAERDLVATRVQCFTGTSDHDRFARLAGMAPDLRLRWFGHCGEPDDLYGGNGATCPDIARQMRDTRTAYHVKRWSDGYGHVIHDWFAVGRPVVGSASYYADKLAGPLFVEGVTSFDIDRMDDAGVVSLLRRLRDDDEYHRTISTNAAVRFREVVDFDAEAEAIARMFEAVL